MTAHVFTRADWHHARRRRAQRGEAPRLAVTRGICLRQAPDGRWFVGVYEQRYGKWSKPEWLCEPTTLKQARAASLSAWRRCGLPIFWSYAGERGFRPFHEGVNEPQAVRA